MKHSQPLRPLKVFTLSRHDPHVIAASQAGTSAHTRPRALSSPFTIDTITTTQLACHSRWPNADKYPDDKAEHDTLSAEEVLDLYESNYDLRLNIQDRLADLIAVNTQEQARVVAEPRPTTEKPLNLKNDPGIEDSEVFHHLPEPESLKDRQGRDSDPSSALSEQVKGPARTTAKNEIAALTVFE